MLIGSSTSSQTLAAARLTQQQQAIVSKLAARDQHVRAHEQAHLAAAGGYAKGGASFTYERGPDGQLYATAGEVGIDTSPVQGDPEATIRKAETIRAAAQAPSDPSTQDRMVAAAASRMELQAQRELARLQQMASEEPARGAAGYGGGPAKPPAGSLISLIG